MINPNLKHKCGNVLSFSKNDSIVVMKPDKGTGVIILDLTDYINKVEQIVSDHTKFKVHKSQDLYKISRSIESKVITSFILIDVYKCH